MHLHMAEANSYIAFSGMHLEKFLDNPIPFDNKAVVPKAI